MLESQVTKVGTNVKRFYSDFVRELLLPLEVPGETQAWVDAQARVKPPALSDSAAEGEKAPGGDKPGASSEGQKEGGVETPGEENVQQREGQAQAEVDGLVSRIQSAPVVLHFYFWFCTPSRTGSVLFSGRTPYGGTGCGRFVGGPLPFASGVPLLERGRASVIATVRSKLAEVAMQTGFSTKARSDVLFRSYPFFALVIISRFWYYCCL